MPLFGAHMSIAGGLDKAFARISLVGGESLQIFSKNQRQWQAPELSTDEIKLFQEAWAQWGGGPVAVHDSYLINLANPDRKKANRAVAAFADEIERAGALGIPYLIMHPGSHVGAGIKNGLHHLTLNLDRAFDNAADAGSGSALTPVMSLPPATTLPPGQATKELFQSLMLLSVWSVSGSSTSMIQKKDWARGLTAMNTSAREKLA